MPKTTKKTNVKKTAYIPKDVNEKILKYMADSNKTFSEVINEAVNSFLKIHANKDDLAITTEIIENTIRKEIKPYMDRIIKFLAKATKSGYASIFIQGQVLAYMFNTDDEREFLKTLINKAESMGYRAVKNYSLDEDIIKMFPKELKIEDF